MIDLSIAQLVEATGGDLRMATLPPLGGAWEPVCGVATDVRQVRPGSIYWDLAPTELGTSAGHALHAFMQSALGVVTSDRRVEPWAGAFCLHVADPAVALGRLGLWARQRYSGRVIACPEPPTDRWTAALIARILRTRQHGTVLTALGGGAAALVSALLELDDRTDFTIFRWPHEKKSAALENSDLCCPDIVAITGSQMAGADRGTAQCALTNGLGQWLASSSDDTCLILNADDPGLCWAALDCPARIYWVGSNERLDLTAKCTAAQPGLSKLEIDGQSLAIEHPADVPVPSILTAIVVGMLQGIDPSRAAGALSQHFRKSTNMPIRAA